MSTKQFVWDGNTIVEERDANNNVTRRFYPQGEQIGGVKYFYTRDHLGSIRELVDSTGVVQARYDYDPFGVRTKLSGSLDAEFGYTGHYYHQTSGLSLTRYRVYDADTGRWLSRDPIGEFGAINLYQYARNDPIRLVDPLGLCPGDWWDPSTWFNQGLFDSLSDTWQSIEASWDDFLNGDWGHLAADAATNPLGQTENNPAAYYTVAGGLGLSGLALGGIAGLEAAGGVGLDGTSLDGKVGLHLADHPFEGLGPRPHLQLNIWQNGVKGSGQVFRYPLPPW